MPGVEIGLKAPAADAVLAEAAAAIAQLRDRPAGIPIGDLAPLPAWLIAALAEFGLEMSINPISREGYCNKTPEQIIDSVSTCNSAPGTEVWVDMINGNNGGAGTQASPFKSGWKGQEVINAAGLPGKLHMVRVGANSLYDIADGFYKNGVTVSPTVDTAYVAHGGIIDLFCASNSVTWVEDATYKGMYTATIATYAGAVDHLNRDPVTRVEAAFPYLASAEAVRYQPGVNYTGTTVTLRRPDGRAPTGFNTRILRAGRVWACLNDVNVAFLCNSKTDGWSFMGGATAGAHTGTMTSYGSLTYKVDGNAVPASKKVLVVDNAVFSHGNRGLELESIHGLAFLNRCGGAMAFTDVYNHHNARSAGQGLLLPLNCWSRMTGIYPQSSCNHLTAHDNANCRILSVGCDFGDGSAGGGVRNIGASLWASFDKYLGFDRGDTAWGGSVQSVSVSIEGTSEAWLWEPTFGGSDLDVVVGASAKVHVKSGRTFKSAGGGLLDQWAAPA